MTATNVTPKWSIPGIGPLSPRLDRIVIVSTVPVGTLKTLLPRPALEQACHSFNIVRCGGPHPLLRSRIVLTCAGDIGPLQILADNERLLGGYSVTEVEAAFDGAIPGIEAAKGRLFELAGLVGKRRHQRGSLQAIFKPDEIPPAGCVPLPTFYLEGRRSSVRLKFYVRHQKHPQGKFGRLILRLEWTLKGKSALERHLGGNQLHDLLAADLNGFLEHNLCLERVNHAAIGDRFSRRKVHTYLTAEQKGHRVLRGLAYREHDEREDWELTMLICANSPAHVRGYLRTLRAGKRPKRRGRPKKPSITHRSPTDHQINACFHKIGLIPVNATGVITLADLKSQPEHPDDSNT